LKRRAACFTIVAACSGASCGRGVVPGATYEQPLFSFSGTISPTGGLGQAKHPIFGLLWTDPLQRTADLTMPPTWLRSTVDRVADTFTVDIFRPPPPAAIVTLSAPSSEISQLALAEIVIVEDADGDGGFSVEGPRATIAAPERYLAGSANVLTYVATPFTSPRINSPLTLPGQVGYVLVNYYCQGQISAGTNPVNPATVEMVLQPSQNFPDVRTCRASHGP
jgi:hypothetical protein